MEAVHVERLDHLGLLASVIKDLGLIAMIDARLVPNPQEEITPGEAVAGMLLNGLGFSNRPLSLTPQFLVLSQIFIAQFIAICRRSKWSKHLTNSPFLALLAMVGSNAARKMSSACLIPSDFVVGEKPV